MQHVKNFAFGQSYSYEPYLLQNQSLMRKWGGAELQGYKFCTQTHR